MVRLLDVLYPYDGVHFSACAGYDPENGSVDIETLLARDYDGRWHPVPVTVIEILATIPGFMQALTTACKSQLYQDMEGNAHEGV